MQSARNGRSRRKRFIAIGGIGTIGALLCVALTASSATAGERYDGAHLYPSYPSYYTMYTIPDTATPLASAYASTDPARTRAEINAWQYNTDYLFGLSRGTAGSAILPAFKAFVFILTVPLDIALLPFAAIGGLFG